MAVRGAAHRGMRFKPPSLDMSIEPRERGMDGEEEEEGEEGGGEGKNPPISEGIGHWPLWSHCPKKGKT